MLLALLKNVVNWVYKACFDNKIAEKEVMIYFGEEIDESNKE